MFELIVKPDAASTTRKFSPGKYWFQVKHHRTLDRPGNIVRAAVLADFDRELEANALVATNGVNFFYLVTNVPSSKEAIAKLDEKRHSLARADFHSDILWQDHIAAWLDQLPQVWSSFPEIFAGTQVPIIGQITNSNTQGLPRTFRLALNAQLNRDGVIRFRQINLEQSLARLFVDLDIQSSALSPAGAPARNDVQLRCAAAHDTSESYLNDRRAATSCIGALVSESADRSRRIILEGGPGQGKSTITQILAQLYRASLLQKFDDYRRIWNEAPRSRLPFRIELRLFSEWLGSTDRTVEQFLAETFSKDAGGAQITVDQLHTAVEKMPVLLIFDGLDEIGSDELRVTVLAKLADCIDRFESQLNCDLRTIVTSRPPAIAGAADRLRAFRRLQIQPLNRSKVDEYVERWTDVQIPDRAERDRVRNSFEKRRDEQHVQALVKNPMQLSVLLHFIRLKGEAFPDRRAELYREYFKTVIDRDVEKSPKLRQNRDEIEALHEVIAYEIHKRAESDSAQSSLLRSDLLKIVRRWLESQGDKANFADELFWLGEERLGLIFALQGEGANARYGFDVQPVREYFAAAFINDKREGDAHELFQEMVRRPYWREVALFLAGLRRANEKADLLSRARQLDRDQSMGWRQDGRAVVLQLLQEGVLTSPGHVYRDAVLFLIESLDPSDRTARHDPRELPFALPALIKTCSSEDHIAALRKLLDESRNIDDEHALWRLYTVANKALPFEVISKYILAFNGNRGDTASRVKLLWPATAQLDVSRLEQSEKWLPTQVDSSWVSAWLPAALANTRVLNLRCTPSNHQALVEQLTFHMHAFRRPFGNEIEFLADESIQYAVWHFTRNLRAIPLLFRPRQFPDLHIPTLQRTDYSGLDQSLTETLNRLITASDETLNELNLGRPFTQCIPVFIRAITNTLDEDGLRGWIGCRTAVALMEHGERPYYLTPESGWYIRARYAAASLSRQSEWRQLRRSLTAFFRTGIPDDVDRSGRTLAGQIVRRGFSQALPSHVLVQGELKSVPALLTDAALESVALPFKWLGNIPIPRYWLPEIFESQPSETGRLLRAMSQHPPMFSSTPSSLNLFQMRRIISVARRSQDADVLAGALASLIGSKFYNLVDIPLAVALLEADSQLLDIGARIFTSSRGEHEGSLFRKQLAEKIIDGSASVSQSTATAAARYLIENVGLNLPPLGSLARAADQI